MDQTALETAHPTGALHSCPKCDGQLAQTDTLARIVKNHGFDLLKLKAQGGRERSCPGCWTTMRIYDLDGLEIDLCPICVLDFPDDWERPTVFGLLFDLLWDRLFRKW